MRDLVAIHDLENRSERCSPPMGGSPLHQAFYLALMELVQTSTESLLPYP
jgi:hypothetical protein